MNRRLGRDIHVASTCYGTGTCHAEAAYTPRPGSEAGGKPALEVWGGLAYLSDMLIVHVHVHVKPESVEAFKTATRANARASRLELGVLGFEALQQADDPTKFVLVEIYRDAAAAAAHKETPHYPVWRDAVAPMMAEPRTSVKFEQVCP